MYRSVIYDIKENHEMYEYCKTVCSGFKNMYNVTNFYIRNVMSGIKKDEDAITLNEKGVLDNVFKMIEKNNKSVNKKSKKQKKQFRFPTKDEWFLGYQELNAIFSLSDNVDYRNLHTHLAQKAIKKCVEAWKSFFSINKNYKTNPSKYLGKCKIPKYIKTEMTTATFSNLAFTVKSDENGRYVEFAKIKSGDKKISGKYYIGDYINTDKFEKIEIKPYHSSFLLIITYIDSDIQEIEDTEENEETEYNHSKVMGIDLGVKNFATITDNLGNEPIIIKGGFLKSKNQYFNKYNGLITSSLQKGTVPTESHKRDAKLEVLSVNRDKFFRDCFYKIAHKICRIAEERDVKEIVIGHNDFWKQESEMGDKNNQNFVNIPFSQFIHILKWTGLKYKIKVIEAEESYTSKASFLDNDEIPTYQKGVKCDAVFSGKRIKRGLYQSKEGIIINADVNASYNIIRKTFEDIDMLSNYSHIKTLNYYDFYPAKKKIA